eukprot:TRINITY_DN3090_c0_g1_i1.p2 TRINITY_DN3090_c0_g1~~TRINITY_DN3090_c0_g1_i1.p2  ORF type:complete len:145 (+),score=19.55 TRINITY_DN3090_c0_g1_i1:54-488(+)
MDALDPEFIQEYHFHVYFLQNNEQSRESAEAIRERLSTLIEQKYFGLVLNKVNYGPRGPHPIGSYEVWCPAEDLPRALSWFMLHRGTHSVLLHPLTRYEIRDHTERAMWLGQPVPLDLSVLSADLGRPASQRPQPPESVSSQTV